MTFPEQNPLHHPDAAIAWFRRHFGVSLPRGLREQADAMSWESFVATYGRGTGPLRLGQWECTDAPRAGPQARNFQAVIALGDRIGTATAAASGPIAALTAMLHQRGITIEIVKFHQMQSSTGTATFIRGSDGARTEWAMGLSDDPTQSALHAVIACANRLLEVEVTPPSRHRIAR